jgi:hypothetical protein
VILFALLVVLVVVISIYMLLDMPRLEASIDRRFPPHGGLRLTQRIERALWGYVKGQAILSIVIGTSAGSACGSSARPGSSRARNAMRCCSALDGVHRGDPVHRPVALGRAARDLRARGRSGRRLWVAALFVFIYQIEGHVVVPNVMASALRLHPLLVIFGLLAGARCTASRRPRRAADDGRGARDLGVLRRADRPRVLGGATTGRRRGGRRRASPTRRAAPRVSGRTLAR